MSRALSCTVVEAVEHEALRCVTGELDTAISNAFILLAALGGCDPQVAGHVTAALTSATIVPP